MKTILITGGSGYIGSWVTKKLLEKGYQVRMTVRDQSKPEKYSHLQKIADASQGNLELWEANLLDKGSFDAPAKGADAIIHMASPFILRFKNARKELIGPALEGTRNVLSAATNSGTVKKVVLTSSVAAVLGDNIDMKEQGLEEFTEEHFNISSSEKHQPYSYSKVLAEKEAWKIANTQDQWKLVVINPSFVMGPGLGKKSNSGSIQFMKDMLGGKYFTGAPDLQFGFVDIRDVAEAHIFALENENAEGRHILAERVMSMYDFSQMIKKLYPGKFKLPMMKAPKFMLYLVGWAFGLTPKFISRNVNYPIRLNNRKSIEKLGLKYTPLEQTVRDMVEWMQAD